MNIQVCARCKKRPAMVFITRIDNGSTVNEGLCLVCASELGIKPVNDMLKKMGIDEEAVQGMSAEIDGLMENALVASDSDNSEGTKVPTLNLSELFGMAARPQPDKDSAKKKKSDSKVVE